MAWWIEMGRFCYPSAAAITYLYPLAIDTRPPIWGSPVENSVIIPNGIKDPRVRRRVRAPAPGGVGSHRGVGEDDLPDRAWQLAYIARVVPIKGLAYSYSRASRCSSIGWGHELSSRCARADRSRTRITISSAASVRGELRSGGLPHVSRGEVNVREMLTASSMSWCCLAFNEGQPVVVLEAMTAGVPTWGWSEVGGMAQLITDPGSRPRVGAPLVPAGVLLAPEASGLPVRDGRRAGRAAARSLGLRANVTRCPWPRGELLPTGGRDGRLQPPLPGTR